MNAAGDRYLWHSKGGSCQHANASDCLLKMDRQGRQNARKIQAGFCVFLHNHSTKRNGLRWKPLVYWSGREDLNLRPLAPHASTLPGCATPRTGAIRAGSWRRRHYSGKLTATKQGERYIRRLPGAYPPRRAIPHVATQHPAMATRLASRPALESGKPG
jgi:hypothetical protein